MSSVNAPSYVVALGVFIFVKVEGFFIKVFVPFYKNELDWGPYFGSM